MDVTQVCDLACKHGSQVRKQDTKSKNFLLEKNIHAYFYRSAEKKTKKNIMWLRLGDMRRMKKQI